MALPRELIRKGPESIFTPESMRMIGVQVPRLQNGESAGTVTAEAIRKGGERIWLECKVRFFERHGPDEIRVTVCMRDVTDRVQLEARLGELGSPHK